MIPQPLHPAIVHFPLVLMFFVPIAAIGAILAIRRGVRPMRAWSIPAALSVALAISAFVSLETGQKQGERVERVVAEAPIESHEEAAERFLALATILSIVTVAGFVRGIPGRSARVVATLGALAVIPPGFSVGKSGGELVYTHGAAQAYTTGSVADRPAADRGDEHRVGRE